MHKRSFIYLSATTLVIVLLIGAVLLATNKNKDYTTLMAIGCDASTYQQDAEAGYLTIGYGERNITVKVDDVNLQNSLSKAKLDDVIGANLVLTVPYEKLKEQHIDVDSLESLNSLNFKILNSDVFDDYLTLQDVFYK